MQHKNKSILLTSCQGFNWRLSPTISQKNKHIFLRSNMPCQNPVLSKYFIFSKFSIQLLLVGAQNSTCVGMRLLSTFYFFIFLFFYFFGGGGNYKYISVYDVVIKKLLSNNLVCFNDRIFSKCLYLERSYKPYIFFCWSLKSKRSSYKQSTAARGHPLDDCWRVSLKVTWSRLNRPTIWKTVLTSVTPTGNVTASTTTIERKDANWTTRRPSWIQKTWSGS